MYFNALRIRQPSGRDVYAFGSTAGDLLKVASVFRIGRDTKSGSLVGYQRPEIIKHIAEIRRYLESEEAVLPNSIVVAFDGRAKFRPNRDIERQLSGYRTPDARPENETDNGDVSEPGILEVPELESGIAPPGFVVDGQQRLAAIASCRHDRFPVFVTAMIADSVDEQRKQFMLVNHTRPLPQGLIFELLPEMQGALPHALQKQYLAAVLTARLNLDPSSALHRAIKTPTCPVGYIKDNSVRRLVLNSLSDGALYLLTGQEADHEHFMTAAVDLISVFWDAVRRVFPQASSLPPERSRLSHGVGVISLGFVMDHLFMRRERGVAWSAEYVVPHLQRIKPFCAWTQGIWDLEGVGLRQWNELQNIDRDIRLLTNHLRRVLTGGVT